MWIDYQVPIGLEGTLAAQVEVRPGDWIYGDAAGVRVIPPDLGEAVLRAAERRAAHAELIRRDCDAGRPVWAVSPKHRRL